MKISIHLQFSLKQFIFPFWEKYEAIKVTWCCLGEIIIKFIWSINNSVCIYSLFKGFKVQVKALLKKKKKKKKKVRMDDYSIWFCISFYIFWG